MLGLGRGDGIRGSQLEGLADACRRHSRLQLFGRIEGPRFGTGPAGIQEEVSIPGFPGDGGADNGDLLDAS